MTIITEAQSIPTSAVGEYYLEGVMETASGFKLNPDKSFEFFFSYGALDRQGKGNWKQAGNEVIFNSEPTGPDYSLVTAKRQASKKLTIRITGASSHLKSMLHAVIKKGENHTTAGADTSGTILFEKSDADSIQLYFELCPEKSFVFPVTDPTLNYYEFKFEPSIMDVQFNDFILKKSGNGFSGPHPMDPFKTFEYKKARRGEDN